MKAAFYRLDYKKFLMCPLIKRLGRALVSKHAVESLKRSIKLLKYSVKLLGVKRKLKAWLSVSKAPPRVCVHARSMLSQSTTVIA